MNPGEAVKLGEDVLEAVLGFADGKLDGPDLMALGALIGDLKSSGLVDQLAALFRERISDVNGLDVRVVP